VVIFGNLRKMIGNVRLAFGQTLENLRKSSERGRKSSKIATNVAPHSKINFISPRSHVISSIYLLYFRGETESAVSAISSTFFFFSPTLANKSDILTNNRDSVN